jgi:unsaturated chondroitin disaccharide hydrolase
LVKFHSTGNIEAANGTSFSSTNTISWVSGSTYHFRVVVNLTAGTYSVYVTPPGQIEQTVATNFAVQVSATSLDHWGLQDTAASMEVCSFAD